MEFFKDFEEFSWIFLADIPHSFRVVVVRDDGGHGRCFLEFVLPPGAAAAIELLGACDFTVVGDLNELVVLLETHRVHPHAVGVLQSRLALQLLQELVLVTRSHITDKMWLLHGVIRVAFPRDLIDGAAAPAPLFDVLAEVMPQIGVLALRARENSAKWQIYEETEKDKETYRKKKPLGRFLKKNQLGND